MIHAFGTRGSLRVPGLVAGALTTIAVALVLSPFFVMSGLNCSYGGNAVVNQGSYETLSYNTQDDSCLVSEAILWAGAPASLAAGIGVGVWRHRRARSSRSRK